VTVTVSGGTVTVAVDYDFSPITAVLMPSRTIHLKRTVVLNSAPMPGD
jgi:hypothetical protein